MEEYHTWKSLQIQSNVYKKQLAHLDKKISDAQKMKRGIIK